MILAHFINAKIVPPIVSVKRKIHAMNVMIQPIQTYISKVVLDAIHALMVLQIVPNALKLKDVLNVVPGTN
jgi:hypothetical protein